MRKIYSFLFLLCVVIISSCTQNEVLNDVIGDGSATEHEMSSDVVIVSRDGQEPDSEIQKRVDGNIDKYQFGNPHSELWKESMLRSSTNLTVGGYDTKVEVDSYTIMFPQGYACDSRIYTSQYYIQKTYQYKKTIQVPNGTSVAIPPQSIMGTYSPMGRIPGTSKIGYAISNLIPSNNTYDTYHLITEVREITHNISGQQIAPLNNPVYSPCNAITPNNFVFVYQIIEW
ncbi:MAG: hypothetical protein LBG45_07730 [Dysgonamonadaceae bacterium]|nr:hypothetical protein [Dysgonamonadaceae bacterium]